LESPREWFLQLPLHFTSFQWVVRLTFPGKRKQKWRLIVKFAGDKPIKIMNIIEKRDFIHSYLHYANEKTIDEFYEKLRKE